VERPTRGSTSDGHEPGGSGASDAERVVEAVRSLVDVMQQGGITELDLAFGDVSVRLRGGTASAPTPVAPSVEDPALAVPDPPAHVSVEQLITAPMVGTFYPGPSPGAPPYVRVGDHVEVGQTIGIIEAMKIMNEIAADRAGLVTAVLVENGQAVEYGSPLIRLDPTRAGVVTVVASGS
jgi:acetyl-CoA carboxylase biotin carboxyl carrier protein